MEEKDNDFCLILNTENVKEMLSKEDEAYYKWADENKDYVNELGRRTRAREEIVEGEFDKYFEM